MAGFGRDQCRLARDKRPDSASGFENTRAFQVPVHARDGVGVDGELHGELADGWQLGAGSQLARGDGGADLVIELHMQWCRMPRVEGEEAPHEY